MRIRTPVPGYALAMIIITATYLAFEAPFAALVVDTLGGNPSPEELDRIEHWGQVISGFAVAVALWGPLLKRADVSGMTAGALAVRFVLMGGAAVLLTYKAEEQLVRSIADLSSASLRQQASRALLARDAAISSSSDKLQGLPGSRDGAEWKAFVGLLPILSHADPSVLAKISDSDAMIREKAAASIPDEAGFRKGPFAAAIEKARQAWTAYRETIDETRKADARQASAMDDRWRNWVSEIRRQGFGPASPPWARQRLVSYMQGQGVPVPNWWHPLDRETWQQAAMGQYRQARDKQLRTALTAILGPEDVRTGIASWDEFVAHLAIQRKLRAALDLPATKAVLTDRMSAAEFRAAVHQPALARLTDKLNAAYGGDPKILADGGALEGFGKSAVKAMVVPAITLAFSIIGMAVHMAKFTNYTLLAMAHRSKSASIFRVPGIRIATAAAAVAGILAAAAAPAAAVTASPFYAGAARILAAKHGRAAAEAVSWTIALQKATYPISSKIGQIGPFRLIEPSITAGLPLFSISALAATPTPGERRW